jgi:hypothetical protein
LNKESHIMSRVIAAILLIAVLVVGGGIIATTAYQAGLSTAVTTATGTGGTVVTPVVVPPYGYGYGWHGGGFGFGIFGFLATLFFLFIIFGLIRAIFWRGGPGRRGGWGGPGGGWGGPGGYGQTGWEGRAHDTFEDWHRRAHGDNPEAGPTEQAKPTGTA